MTTMSAAASAESRWKRFWRRLAEIEEDLSLGYQGWQDRRIERVETELTSLRTAVEGPQKQREHADRPGDAIRSSVPSQRSGAV